MERCGYLVSKCYRWFLWLGACAGPGFANESVTIRSKSASVPAPELWSSGARTGDSSQHGEQERVEVLGADHGRARMATLG